MNWQNITKIRIRWILDIWQISITYYRIKGEQSNKIAIDLTTRLYFNTKLVRLMMNIQAGAIFQLTNMAAKEIEQTVKKSQRNNENWKFILNLFLQIIIYTKLSYAFYTSFLLYILRGEVL